MITFLLPPESVPRGGTKYTIRMAETLRDVGHDVALYEDKGRPPAYVATSLPMVGGRFDRTPEDVFVIPEDQRVVLKILKDFPQKKVVYCQNQFYAAQGLDGAPSYLSYGVTHMLCSSRSVLDYAKRRHGDLHLHYVPYGIDATRFRSHSLKVEQIAFNPFKRPVELRYVHDMFRFLYPEHRNWLWKPLAKAGESEAAEAMAISAVFLSLNKLDSLGLMPLEAMLSGCVVAGFTGRGADEYAGDANGFWIRDDDLDGCVLALKRAVDMVYSDGIGGYRRAARETASRYDVPTFAQATRDAWTQILRN